MLLLLTSIIWGSAFAVQQIGMQKGLGPMTFTGLRFALGCLSLVPVIIWWKNRATASDRSAKPPHPGTFYQIKAASGAIAYAGLMSVGVAFTMQVVCQKHCPPAPAAIIMSLEAVFAALAGYLVLHQTLPGRVLIGCLLIVAGVLMVQLVLMMRRMQDDALNPSVHSPLKVDVHPSCTEVRVENNTVGK
ncbi:MAG: DMT family transporter [Verrucomicrobia bacterium]|nr:DMT family transporter [Verrucomicrobiota bacterium]